MKEALGYSLHHPGSQSIVKELYTQGPVFQNNDNTDQEPDPHQIPGPSQGSQPVSENVGNNKRKEKRHVMHKRYVPLVENLLSEFPSLTGNSCCKHC